MNKQIKEMTKDYKLCCPCEMFGGYIDDNGNLCGDIYCIDGNDCTKCGVSTDLARFLIKQGYQRANDDSVVLTESEYEELIEAKAELIKLKSQTVSDIRQEMAREVLQKIKLLLEETIPFEDYHLEDFEFTGETIQEVLDEVAKQCGVEVEQ